MKPLQSKSNNFLAMLKLLGSKAHMPEGEEKKKLLLKRSLKCAAADSAHMGNGKIPEEGPRSLKIPEEGLRSLKIPEEGPRSLKILSSCSEWENPWRGTEVTENPWRGTEVTENPWRGTEVTENPWRGTEVTETPQLMFRMGRSLKMDTGHWNWYEHVKV